MNEARSPEYYHNAISEANDALPKILEMKNGLEQLIGLWSEEGKTETIDYQQAQEYLSTVNEQIENIYNIIAMANSALAQLN